MAAGPAWGKTDAEINKKNSDKIDITSGKLRAEKLRNNSSVHLGSFIFQMQYLHFLMHFDTRKMALLVTVDYGSTG